MAHEVTVNAHACSRGSFGEARPITSFGYLKSRIVNARDIAAPETGAVRQVITVFELIARA
jgi:hypothetical protein